MRSRLPHGLRLPFGYDSLYSFGSDVILNPLSCKYLTGLFFFAIVATSAVFIFIIQDGWIGFFDLSIYFFWIFFCAFWHLIIFFLHSNPSCKLKRHPPPGRYLYFFRLFFFSNSFCFFPFWVPNLFL